MKKTIQKGNSGKILLIHAPFRKFMLGSRWSGTPSLAPPLGLMYLAYPLIKKGYKVDFIDFNVDRLTEQEFKEKILSHSIIGISCYSESLVNVKKIIKFIRNIKRDAYIMCGGPYCNLSENYIEDSDLVTIGEAEAYIDQIVERIIRKRSLRNIPGIIYRKKKKVIRTRGRMQVHDINRSRNASLLLGKDKDYGHFFGFKFDNIIGVMTSRGCPYNCFFCTHKARTSYRVRDVENVMVELRDLVRSGYKYIAFYDDNFLVNRKRATDIMDCIIREKLDIKIIVQGRVDSCDLNFYRKLKEAGVAMIMFGIESANQDVLDYYNKRIKIETIRKAVSLTNKVGILSFGYFIIGAPIETEQHFINDERLINDSHVDFVNINVLGYYQGSKLWEDAVGSGIISEKQTIVWANKKLSQFAYHHLAKIREDLLKRIYSNPLRLFRIMMKIIRMGEISILIKMIVRINKDIFEIFNNPFIPQEKKSSSIVVRNKVAVKG